MSQLRHWLELHGRRHPAQAKFRRCLDGFAEQGLWLLDDEPYRVAAVALEQLERERSSAYQQGPQAEVVSVTVLIDNAREGQRRERRPRGRLGAITFCGGNRRAVATLLKAEPAKARERKDDRLYCVRHRDATGFLIGVGIFYAILIVFGIIVQWKIFTKAGEPGWASIVPIYNVMILSKICGRGEMFGLLILIPCPLVTIVIMVMLIFDLAKVFGKGTGFGLGLVFLGFIFYPMLGFGSAQYTRPSPRA